VSRAGRWRLVLAALTGMTVALAQGCSVMDEDAPGRACKASGDCFVTQGETCNVATLTCEPRAVVIDAGRSD